MALVTRIVVTLAALGLAAAHVLVPYFKLDHIALTLLGVALLPWLAVLLRALRLPDGISSLELPWGIKITGADIGTQRRRREQEVRELQEGSLTAPASVELPSFASKPVEPSPPPLAAAHLLAEELAFRKLESELGITIRRQRRLQPFKEGLVVDGFFVRDGISTIVEVKYLRRPSVSHHIFSRLFSDITDLRARRGALRRVDNIELLLVVVADMGNEDLARLDASLHKSIEESPCPTRIRVLDFQQLRREFGVSGGA